MGRGREGRSGYSEHNFFFASNEKYSLIITGQTFCVHRLISYNNLKFIARP